MYSRNAKRIVVAGAVAVSLIVGIGAGRSRAAEPGHALAPGCQANVAVGQWSGEAMQAIVDAGGWIQVDNVGVYQITAHGYTLHEDDERWLDLRDYEIECQNISLPVITVGVGEEPLTQALYREAQDQ